MEGGSLAVAVAAALRAFRMLPRGRMPEVDNLSTARGAECVGRTLYFCGLQTRLLSATPDGRAHGVLVVKVQWGLILTLH